MLPYNRNLRDRSRQLRNNMTSTERVLWERIRQKQLNDYAFTRQKPLGGYIVDFYSKSAGLVIEIDGGQHFTEEGKEYDREKDAYLKGLGLTVLRISNSEVVSHIDKVIDQILNELP